MHTRHSPPSFLTITGLAIQVGYFTSKRIYALTRGLTWSYIPWLQSAANVLFFCRTGLTSGSMLRQCVMILGDTPVISRGDQANTSLYSRSSWTTSLRSWGTSARPTLTTLIWSSSYRATSSISSLDAGVASVFAASSGICGCYAYCGRDGVTTRPLN